MEELSNQEASAKRDLKTRALNGAREIGVLFVKSILQGAAGAIGAATVYSFTRTAGSSKGSNVMTFAKAKSL